MFKELLKTGKKYADYLMGLDFSELLINILEILGMAVLAALVYIPFGLFQDLIYELVRASFGTSEVVFRWYNVIFELVTGLVAVAVFLYLFNRRYSNLDKLIEKDPSRHKKHKENTATGEEKKEEAKAEIDLPKKKD